MDNNKSSTPQLEESKFGLISSDESASPAHASSQTVYVRRFLRTKHAMLFKLSDKCVQLKIEDGTELILDSNNRRVMYLDPSSNLKVL